MNENKVDKNINNVKLSNLNDLQNMLLSQLSYVEIDDCGRKIICGNGLKVSDLHNYLSNPNDPFFGTFNERADDVAKRFANSLPIEISDLSIVNALCDVNLGNITIIGIHELGDFKSNGFQALAFKDSFGSIGISYRGSDINFSQGMIRDWLEADLLEYFINDSSQANSAKKFFERYKDTSGNNFLYGHSLGGNLVQHVFVEKHNEIKQAFTINGNPINKSLIDTDEKMAAFNDHLKMKCNVICGDIVGWLKDNSVYESNVNYVKNSGKLTGICSHFAQAAQFDEKGNFVLSNRDEALQSLGSSDLMLSLIRALREAMNGCGLKALNEQIRETMKRVKRNSNSMKENKR